MVGAFRVFFLGEIMVVCVPLPVLDCDTVDLVTVDHGVGEPGEQVLGGQQGHPLR